MHYPKSTQLRRQFEDALIERSNLRDPVSPGMEHLLTEMKSGAPNAWDVVLGGTISFKVTAPIGRKAA